MKNNIPERLDALRALMKEKGMDGKSGDAIADAETE